MNPVLRITTIVMFAGICFGVILPLAIVEHKTWVAVGIPLVFAFYLVANIVLWRRMKQRS